MAPVRAPLDTVYSTRTAIDRHVVDADVVIGGVLIPGAAAPKLVTADMIRRMKPGSVVVDVAIDQGGCIETSHPTTHSEPTFIVDDVVHYCVANMPGAVPRTSTFALNNATLPHVLTLANKGYRRALADDPHLRNGPTCTRGRSRAGRWRAPSATSTAPLSKRSPRRAPGAGRGAREGSPAPAQHHRIERPHELQETRPHSGASGPRGARTWSDRMTPPPA